MFGIKMMKSLRTGFSSRGLSRLFSSGNDDWTLSRRLNIFAAMDKEERLREEEKLKLKLRHESMLDFIKKWEEGLMDTTEELTGVEEKKQILSSQVRAFALKGGVFFTKAVDKMVQMIKCPMLPMGDLPFVDIIRVSLELQNLCREQLVAFLIKTTSVHLYNKDWEKVQNIMISSKSPIPRVVQIRDLLEHPEIAEQKLMEMQMLCDNQLLAFHIKANSDPSFITLEDKQTIIKLMAYASLDIPILERIRNYLEGEEILELQLYACILKRGCSNYFAGSEFHQLTVARLEFKSQLHLHSHSVNYIKIVNSILTMDEVLQEMMLGVFRPKAEKHRKYENSEELKYKVHELVQTCLSLMSMDTNEEERKDDGLPSLHKDDDKQDLPEPEEPDTNIFLTPDELERGKLPPEEILSHPMFKNYTPGNPGPVLHIKNLSRFVIADDFYFIFGSLFGNIEDAKGLFGLTEHNGAEWSGI